LRLIKKDCSSVGFSRMNALFVAWQDPESRSWSPVGRLTHEGDLFKFVYTKGAENLGDRFHPFGAMNDIYSSYVSEVLFPIFANRVLPKSRPEYATYLEWLGMSEAAYDVMAELSLTGGYRATDTLELFPCPEPTSQNKYIVYFFSRGLRHMHEENQVRANELIKGDRLYLMSDVQNEYDAYALVLRTGEPITLVGYAPRYYSPEFSNIVGEVGQENIKVTVEQVNVLAPLQYRILCKLESPWPANFSPCVDEKFKTLA